MSGLILPGGGTPDAGVIDVGFRFKKSQARILEELARRAELLERGFDAVSLFRQAAAATRAGEALRVRCTSLDEARELAQAFPIYGVVEPTLEHPRAEA